MKNQRKVSLMSKTSTRVVLGVLALLIAAAVFMLTQNGDKREEIITGSEGTPRTHESINTNGGTGGVRTDAPPSAATGGSAEPSGEQGAQSSQNEAEGTPSSANLETSVPDTVDLNAQTGALPAPASGGTVEAGAHNGGTDMPIGAWYSTNACTYTLNNESAPMQNGGVAIVEIRKGDQFSSQCAWKAGYPPLSAQPTYGWHVVGKDIDPGKWSPKGSDCGVALMTDLRGDHAGKDAYTYLAPGQKMILTSGDIFYSTAGCESWTN